MLFFALCFYSLNFRVFAGFLLVLMPEIDQIDAIDRKILAALQHDGRMSNLKLAEAVSLSPTAVLARTQRLIRDGFIVGLSLIHI